MVAYSFKKRFVTPIRYGLGLMPIDGKWLPCESVIELGQRDAIPFDPFKHLERTARPKRQTIRAVGKRRHARPGETLQLYTAMRTKQCKKIGEARCTAVLPIRIMVNEHSMPVEVDGRHVGVGSHDYPGGLRELAQLDGFEHAEDMHEFWKKEHGLGEFSGVLIKWEPI